MVVSMIGIISIQTNWIRSSIAERERAFEVHVNDALNAVNEDISQDEAEFFVRSSIGDLDSIVDELIFSSHSGSPAEIEINMQTWGPGTEKKIVVSNHRVRDSNRRIEIQTVDSVRTERIIRSDFPEKMGGNLPKLDTVMRWVGEKKDPLQRVESMVEHYTFETLFSGDLNERIPPDSLRSKIKKALIKEGIHTTFDFAVKNTKSQELEKGFVSKNFDSKARPRFTKSLFENDRRNPQAYQLLLQPKDNSTYVWSHVWKMTVLSSLFTILILISFGYALYFIFKQKKMSQVKNDFINNMTHELKTPLASISLAAASINHPEIIGNPEEIRRLTRMIETEKERIHGHVERVLDTAALDLGELKLQFETVHLQELIQKAQKNIEMALTSAQGSVSNEGDLAKLMVYGDSFHLVNVLTNILDNSIKYRSARPLEIGIRAMDTETGLEILISDNGIGMTSKEQKMAFKPFYRAESGDIHSRKGFGLGLSYVKSIVAKHRGTVELESRIGHGTTVKIKLPKRHESN